MRFEAFDPLFLSNTVGIQEFIELCTCFPDICVHRHKHMNSCVWLYFYHEQTNQN